MLRFRPDQAAGLLSVYAETSPPQGSRQSMLRRCPKSDKADENFPPKGKAVYAAEVPTETGKNLAKTAEKRKDRYENQPMYKKDIQPVKVVKEEKEELTESKEKTNVLEEEIQRLKDLSNYNEKTQ